MLARFRLNCPRCRKQLVQVPLDGLTLFFECAEHGALILRPLVVIDEHEGAEAPVDSHHVSDEQHGANAR